MTPPGAVEDRMRDSAVQGPVDDQPAGFAEAPPHAHADDSPAESAAGDPAAGRRNDRAGEVRLLDLLIVVCRGRHVVLRTTLASAVVAVVIVLLVLEMLLYLVISDMFLLARLGAYASVALRELTPPQSLLEPLDRSGTAAR